MTYLNFETNIKEKLNRLDYLKKTEVSSGHSIDIRNNQLFCLCFCFYFGKRNNQFEQETLHSSKGNNISIWNFNLKNKNKMENTIWIFSCRIKFKTEIKESSKVVPKQNIFISDFDFCLESWELFFWMKTLKKFESPSSIFVTAVPILNCFDIHIIIVFVTLNEINSDGRVQGGQKGRWKDNDPEKLNNTCTNEEP